MDRALLRVAWYRFVTTLRRRWTGYVGLALLIGLVGGIAMASIAGARRTQSSFGSYLRSTQPSDLTVSFYAAGPQVPLGDVAASIERLPGVRRVAPGYTLFGARLRPDGTPLLDAVGNVTTTGSAGLYISIDRAVPIKGRTADPARPDEFVVTVDAARALGLQVGQRVPLGFYSADQLTSPGFGTAAVRPLVRQDMTLVGLVELSSQIVHDDVDGATSIVLFTPALTTTVLRLTGTAGNGVILAIQLTHGRRDVAAVEQAIVRLMPAGSLYNFHLTSSVVERVNRAVKPEAIALGVFGLIASLATLVIAVQGVARQVRAGADDLEVLRSMGAGPVAMLLDSAAGVLLAVASGSLFAAALAVILSPLAPIGPVRPVDPLHGFHIDWTVIGLGTVILVVGLSAIAFGIAWRIAPHRATGRQPDRTSAAVRWAASSGLPPSGVVGLRFALDPGRGRGAVPVRSALVGTTLAVVLVIATLTFGSGLRTLVSHPALYGWNWNYALSSSNNVPPQARDLLDRDPLVTAWTGASDNATANINGLSIPVFLVDSQAAFSPPILSGHALRGPGEIVLGASTLRQLRKRVGDTVTLSYGSPATAPAYIAPTPVVIAGTVTLPALGQPSYFADHPSMGVGGLVSRDIEPAAFKAVTTDPNPTLDGPDEVFVRLRPGISAAAGRADLQRIADAADKAFAAVPNDGGAGDVVEVLPVQRPAEIVNYRSMGATPALLAAGLAGGAVVALGLILTASVHRRRRELALLKTLGFTRRQLAAALAWQATAAAVIGVIVGVPLGIAAGRWLWTLFAREIFAVPKPTVPAGSVALVAVATIVLANVVAAVPGRVAAHTRAALVLRAE